MNIFNIHKIINTKDKNPGRAGIEVERVGGLFFASIR